MKGDRLDPESEGPEWSTGLVDDELDDFVEYLAEAWAEGLRDGLRDWDFTLGGRRPETRGHE